MKFHLLVERHVAAQYTFDEHGHLNMDHYDVLVSGPYGSHSAGEWNASAGLTMSRELTSAFTPHLLVTNRTLIVGAELVSLISTWFIYIKRNVRKEILVPSFLLIRFYA